MVGGENQGALLRIVVQALESAVEGVDGAHVLAVETGGPAGGHGAGSTVLEGLAHQVLRRVGGNANGLRRPSAFPLHALLHRFLQGVIQGDIHVPDFQVVLKDCLS